MKKILIDTDPGMDDTLAIILAIKSKAVELLGISSVAGNYPIEVTTRTGSTTNSLRLLTTAAWKIGSANRER